MKTWRKKVKNSEYIDFFLLNGFNGHFRNIAYNSVRWACLVSLAPKRGKEDVPFSMDIGNGELIREFFRNPRPWEQKE